MEITISKMLMRSTADFRNAIVDLWSIASPNAPVVFNLEAESEKREKAADNLIVLAREKAGAQLLFKEGVVQRIARLLKVTKIVTDLIICRNRFYVYLFIFCVQSG